MDNQYRSAECVLIYTSCDGIFKKIPEIKITGGIIIVNWSMYTAF